MWPSGGVSTIQAIKNQNLQNISSRSWVYLVDYNKSEPGYKEKKNTRGILHSNTETIN